MEIWRSRDGSDLVVIAATWETNPKITFESLEAEFRNNPVKAWRNYGSRVDANIENAIKDPDALLRQVNTTRANPWNQAREEFFLWFRGRPGLRHFIHFDLSKSGDSTGVAMVHRDKDRKGLVVVDFMVQIEIPVGRNIDYGKLRERFVYDITSRGFYVEQVSYDQFQSDETRQVLEEKGYHTERVSADREPTAYDTLIELILGGRLDYYAYPVFIREMQELVWNGRKYDHPRKGRNGKPGTKDVADAVACASLAAIQYELTHPASHGGKLKVFQPGRQWAQPGLASIERF